MYKLSYCEEKNRISIVIEGTFPEEDVESYLNDLRALVDKTKPGFTVLGDTTKGDMSFYKMYNRFQPVRDYAVTKGFRNVATVLGPELYTLFMEKPFEGVKNVFTSIEEAEKFLNE